MNALLQWLTAPEWAQVVKALLHSLWQGALIATVLAIVLRVTTRPALRYRLALSGLGLLVLSTILTWAILNSPEPKAVPTAPALAQPVEVVPMTTEPAETVVVTANWTPAQPTIQWTAWMALVWLIGASAMLGRASVKVAGAEQLRRGCKSLNDPRIAGLLAEARKAVKLTRQVRIAVTEKLTSPAVVGVLVPTLILPLSLITTLSPEQIRFVLLHELAHIRRGDYLANLFQLLAEALFFFNPAVWWISHQIRQEREACCDALAIELSGAPADYAQTLVHVAENVLNPAPAAAPAFGRKDTSSTLTDRVQRVLVPGHRPSLRLTWRAMLAALAVGVATLTLLAIGTRQTVAAVVGDSDTEAITPATADISKPQLNPPPKVAYDIPSGQASSAFHGYKFGSVFSTIKIRADGIHRAANVVSLEQLETEFRDIQEGMNSATAGDFVRTLVIGDAPLGSVRDVTRLIQNLGISNSITYLTISEEEIDQNLLPNTFLRRYKVDATQLITSLDEKTGSTMAPDDYGKALQKLWTLLAAGSDDGSKLVVATFSPSDSVLAVRAKKKDLDLLSTLLESMRIQFSVIDDGLYFQPLKQPDSTSDGADTSSASSEDRRMGITETDRMVQDGKLLYELGKIDEAIEKFNAALAADPENRAAKYYLNPAQSASGEKQISREFDTKGPALASALQAEPTGTNSLQANANTNLYTRTYKVDPNEFAKAVDLVGPAPTTNAALQVRQFFAEHGLNFEPPKTFFYKDTTGLLWARATLEELDTIEGLIQVMNSKPLQVNIRAKFVEMPEDGFEDFLGNALAITNRVAGFTGILTDPQCRVALKALEQREGVDILSAPEVTTLSGRQAQIQVVDIQSIVTGVIPMMTNGISTNVFQVTPLPFGPVLDVVPVVSDDGYTIQMVIIPTVTEFLGYDDPGEFRTGNPWGVSVPVDPLPLPKYRQRHLATSLNVWDGQTVVLGGFISETVTRHSDGSASTNSTPALDKRQLLVFITPTIIDPAGNRVHSAEEMPFATNSVPVQAKPTVSE